MGDFPDLMEVLVNIGGSVEPVVDMIRTIAALMGLYLVGSGLIEVWGVTHDNALKYVAGRQRFSVGSALISIFVGAMLLATADLAVIRALGHTLSGNTYSAGQIISASMKYSGPGMSEKAQAASMVILGIMQIVGMIAMIKGWMTINRYYNNQQAGLGQAAGWLIGGVLCWNFKWFVDVLNATIGFKVFTLFTPF